RRSERGGVRRPLALAVTGEGPDRAALADRRGKRPFPQERRPPAPDSYRLPELGGHADVQRKVPRLAVDEVPHVEPAGDCARCRCHEDLAREAESICNLDGGPPGGRVAVRSQDPERSGPDIAAWRTVPMQLHAPAVDANRSRRPDWTDGAVAESHHPVAARGIDDVVLDGAV